MGGLGELKKVSKEGPCVVNLFVVFSLSWSLAVLQ